MSINGDCPYCGGHSTDAEWDAWSGECQWCGEFDVEWSRNEDDESEDSEDDFEEDGYAYLDDD